MSINSKCSLKNGTKKIPAVYSELKEVLNAASHGDGCHGASAKG